VHVVALVHEPLVAPGEHRIVEDQQLHAADVRRPGGLSF
jgi:hypothetical protein